MKTVMRTFNSDIYKHTGNQGVRRRIRFDIIIYLKSDRTETNLTTQAGRNNKPKARLWKGLTHYD